MGDMGRNRRGCGNLPASQENRPRPNSREEAKRVPEVIVLRR